MGYVTYKPKSMDSGSRRLSAKELAGVLVLCPSDKHVTPSISQSINQSINQWEFAVAQRCTEWFFVHSLSNWRSGFCGGRKTSQNWEKNLWSKDYYNQQQTHIWHWVWESNQATLVGDGCSHHCCTVALAPKLNKWLSAFCLGKPGRMLDFMQWIPDEYELELDMPSLRWVWQFFRLKTKL